MVHDAVPFFEGHDVIPFRRSFYASSFEGHCGGHVLGKTCNKMVATHVPTEDLPGGNIRWRILPTNRGSRSNNNPRVKRRGDPCWLNGVL